MDYEKAVIKGEFNSALLNGNKLFHVQINFDNKDKGNFKNGDLIRVYNDCNEFKAVYTFVENENCFKPYKMFL
jgi:hypothetical protein